MSRVTARSPASSRSLDRLRRRLTGWYVGTFLAILALLGGAMFAVITRQLDRDVDESLREAGDALARAIATRGARGAADALPIPNRTLLVLDRAGRTIDGSPAEPWIAALAGRVLANGPARATHRNPDGRSLRAYARPVTTAIGRVAAVAIADEIELEDRYSTLIIAFGAGSLAALVLVGVGGWLLARKTTEPVERSIEHMRRFMADAAHELRTPIAVVRSRAEVALQRPRDAGDYVASLRAIDRETGRLTRIVDDLLMLARADAGERPIARERLFLDDVTSDAVEAARAIAARKSVHVEVEAFDEAPVVGDPALLRQLAMILLDNAIKYSPSGGRVQVAVRAAAKHVELVVADRGAGISADQLPHVFERFFRGDPARGRDTGDDAPPDGAGLGLAIAQWIVEEHGGAIRLTSEVKRGTRVTVELSLATPASALSSS